ncbi:MAG: ACT domain-containing protein [Gammaproteobacteria bacterium]|nr:ACT domain-containing protein [Gammaproteobacteria bacterium]
MSHWFMVTLVGKDRPGIVAHVTSALYDEGCNLGETSMLRLGGNFTIMMMVSYNGNKKGLENLLLTVAQSLDLQLHVDAIEAGLHQHLQPQMRITVSGADRAGIVAKVTTALSEVGFNILELESDVAGTEARPIYIMHIEGSSDEGMDAVAAALEVVRRDGIDVKLSPIDTLIG